MMDCYPNADNKFKNSLNYSCPKLRFYNSSFDTIAEITAFDFINFRSFPYNYRFISLNLLNKCVNRLSLLNYISFLLMNLHYFQKNCTTESNIVEN